MVSQLAVPSEAEHPIARHIDTGMDTWLVSDKFYRAIGSKKKEKINQSINRSADQSINQSVTATYPSTLKLIMNLKYY